jgi:hypothetical protein
VTVGFRARSKDFDQRQVFDSPPTKKLPERILPFFYDNDTSKKYVEEWGLKVIPIPKMRGRWLFGYDINCGLGPDDAGTTKTLEMTKRGWRIVGMKEECKGLWQSQRMAVDGMEEEL